jgi:thioredoxin-like negative regulator of GroEL
MDSLVAQIAQKERRYLRVAHVDIYERPDLADRFRVHAAPTLILVKQGRVVERIEGRAKAAEIKGLLESYLFAETAREARSESAA